MNVASTQPGHAGLTGSRLTGAFPGPEDARVGADRFAASDAHRVMTVKPFAQDQQ